MAIVRWAKYTGVRKISRGCLLEISRVNVYFAGLTIAITKIRDY